MRARLTVRITPDDVGRRVTVRAVWHGPEAASHDVVGVLESWRDGQLHITTRDGERRTVAEADLLAARTVPNDAPQPRRRS